MTELNLTPAKRNCDGQPSLAPATGYASGLKHLDLFSGIGGFAIAARAAGFQTIGFSEINPYDCQILKELWPDVPNHGDIRNIRGIPCDLITGGFPCQPFSTAGKRAGAADDRALWPEMCRVIKESKPSWVLGENVAGIISMELDRVLSDLEALGYSAWPVVIPACAVDAKHRRDRVWIVGYSDSFRSRRAENGQSHNSGNDGDAKGAHEFCEPARSSGTRKENVADVRTGNARTRLESAAGASERHESGRETEMPSADGGHGDARRNAGNGADIRRGEVAIWQPEPGVGRSLDGLSAGLDRNCLILESHKLLLAYGKTTNQRPDEVLSALRDSITPQNIQWTAGGCNSISAAEILLAYLRELEARPFDEARIQLAGTEALKASLRSVRTGDKSPRASSRPRQQQQCTGEHPDTLQALSRLLAQHSQKAWQISRWQDASTLPWGDGWEVGTPRMAHGVSNRPHRLKGLGNAIVPQVATVILKAMARTHNEKS